MVLYSNNSILFEIKFLLLFISLIKSVDKYFLFFRKYLFMQVLYKFKCIFIKKGRFFANPT